MCKKLGPWETIGRHAFEYALSLAMEEGASSTSVVVVQEATPVRFIHATSRVILDNENTVGAFLVLLFLGHAFNQTLEIVLGYVTSWLRPLLPLLCGIALFAMWRSIVGVAHRFRHWAADLPPPTPNHPHHHGDIESPSFAVASIVPVESALRKRTTTTTTTTTTLPAASAPPAPQVKKTTAIAPMAVIHRAPPANNVAYVLSPPPYIHGLDLNA